MFSRKLWIIRQLFLNLKMSDLEKVIKQLDRIETAMKFSSGYIAGYADLASYLGHTDKRGRTAKGWAAVEGLTVKPINGVPHFSKMEVDRAMRNGRAIETRKEVA